MSLLTAGIMAAGAIGGALIGGRAAKKSADVQAQAATQASTDYARAAAIGSQTQLQMFEQTRADLAPWRETGARALTRLEEMYLGGEGLDKFRETPGYQFRFGEGLRALDRSAAAKGRLMSGGHDRGLIRYGQGIASQEFNTYANRLASLAGVGQSTAVQTGQLGQQAAATAGQIGMQGAVGGGQALMQAGTARASGYVGAANAITGGIGNLAYTALGQWGGLDPRAGVQRPTAPNPNWGF